MSNIQYDILNGTYTTLLTMVNFVMHTTLSYTNGYLNFNAWFMKNLSII